MAELNGSLKPHKAHKVKLPPKRGQVKIQILRSLKKTVSMAISKAVALVRKKKKGRTVVAEGSAFINPDLSEA